MLFSSRQLTLIGLLLVIGFVLMACSSTPNSTQEEPANGPIIPPTTNESNQAAQAMQDADSSDAELEPVISTTGIEWTEDGSSVIGAESTLVRMNHGIYATFKTAGLEPGDAYTIWWVIFNNPENCSNGQCGPEDIFLADETGELITNDDGAAIANANGREVTSASILRATGSVIDEDGRAEFRAHLPLGDTIEASFGPGLVNLLGAEIHLFSRTHGPAIPGLLHEQLNTPWGGCPEGWPKDPCTSTQFVAHRPLEG